MPGRAPSALGSLCLAAVAGLSAVAGCSAGPSVDSVAAAPGAPAHDAAQTSGDGAPPSVSVPSNGAPHPASADAAGSSDEAGNPSAPDDAAPAAPAGDAGSSDAASSDAGSSDAASSDAASSDAASSDDSGIVRPRGDGGGYTPPFDPSTVAGVQPLFDGATLTGWNCNTAPGGWAVIDGTIVGKAAVAGQFCATQQSYSEFRLFASIMQVSGAGGHSGIGFGGQTPPSGKWGNGDFKFLDLMTPSFYFWDYLLNAGARGRIVSSIDMTKAPYNVPWSGQWFQLEMTVSLATGVVRAALNGVDYLTYNIGTPNPFKSGPVGLQAHAGNQEVRYKDLWIQVNPSDPNTLLSKK
ncbi:MAG: DUF1080 domain-containing protein [Myxococcota bacterium]|nr:DUF1080 domain-containing protein [Myxococcota bacterium]